ncbi:MAG: hypothetical protein HMLIMOIP_002481 [Candidatus Nitrosomirales archaeon]|jgi:hypothetical protein
METNAKRLRKYSTISLGVVLVMAFVLVQPTMQASYAVSAEDQTDFDDCELDDHEDGVGDTPEDAISMNTVIKSDIVKTIHVEKEKFTCFLTQGDIQVAVDVDTYVEVFENITAREVIEASSLVVTCVKEPKTATTIGCLTYTPSTTTVFVGSDCEEMEASDNEAVKHPQEMNTVKKGNIVKTIQSQKEWFDCPLNNDDTDKKVDIIIFTEIYENIATHEVLDVQTHEMRCVVLLTNDDNDDDPDDDQRDAQVESCIFRTLPLAEE